MKNCKKCDKSFPFNIIIDGVKRNLKNRRYCLECSPFNLHNTKKLDNNFKCLVCDSDLQGNKTKYCSNKCKQTLNNDSYHYQVLRGLYRKYKLVELKGGKCQDCGYKKNISALDFHHKDSREKDSSLNSRVLSNSTWEYILKEAEKCDLLCSNCHREKHYPENTLENILNILKENKYI